MHVVLVTIDTLRADRLGCYGSTRGLTPNLDRIAARGVVFENATAQAPSTTPSHASMFTGTYPTTHQVRNAGGFALDAAHRTLAEILKEKGWQTAAFVGASVLDRVYGLDQGFGVYDDRMPTARSAGGEEASRPAGAVVDRALGWLEKQDGARPVFLWVHVYDPHAPHDPPQPFKRTYRKSPYDGEVAYADRELGRLFDAVGRRLPPDRTVTAVLADHGESLSEHGEYYHGVFLYDATLRIPWILLGPEIPAGRRIPSQVRTIDLLPTLMALVRGDAPSGCQGINLVPALDGRPIATNSYAEALYPKLNMGWAELRSIRTNRWKYIRAPRPELYDLSADPSESVNVLDRHPVEAQKLRLEMERIVASEGKPETVRIKTVSAATEERLAALGYVSAGAPRTLALTGEGIDPKDRIHILKLLERFGSDEARTDLQQRIRLLERARREDPTNPVLYYLLGQSYQNSQQPERALEVYRTALTREATATSKIHARMGALFGELGRLDEAVASFEKAIELDPTDLESHDKLALAYLLEDRVADAERILKGVLSLDDANAQAHNNMGWIALKKKDARGARRHFERALELDPNLLEAYLNLASIHKEAGDHRRARASFEKYLARASAERDAETIAKVRRELAELPPTP